jgi:ribosomal-protein-alanine N-acetyltransferase
MTPELETDRLLLRPLRIEDAAETQILFPHWEVVRYLANVVPWPYPADGALTFYRDVAIPAMASGDAWHWSLRLKSAPDHLIGGISLHLDSIDNRGFWLSVPWQGQGLMTAACNVVTDFWFFTLKQPVLRVPKAIANTASRRISERSGMRIIDRVERDYVAGRLPAEVWEITADEWRRYRTGAVAERG